MKRVDGYGCNRPNCVALLVVVVLVIVGFMY